MGYPKVKTLRISDDIHGKLTATVGTLMAQTARAVFEVPRRADSRNSAKMGSLGRRRDKQQGQSST